MFNFKFLTSDYQLVLTPNGKGPDKSNVMEIATTMNLEADMNLEANLNLEANMNLEASNLESNLDLDVASEPTATGVMVDQVIEQVMFKITQFMFNFRASFLI